MWKMVSGIKSPQSCRILPRCCFWDCYREVGGICPLADIRPVTNSMDGLAVLLYSHHVRSAFSSWIWRGSVLTRVIEALTEAASRNASHPDKAGVLWAEGHGLRRFPVSSGGDPSLPSTLHGSNTPIHHGPSLVFSQGITQYFAAIFLPPLIAVSQGWLCSNITDTGWRSGSNEYTSWVYQEEQQTLLHASFSLSVAFLLFFSMLLSFSFHIWRMETEIHQPFSCLSHFHLFCFNQEDCMLEMQTSLTHLN